MNEERMNEERINERNRRLEDAASHYRVFHRCLDAKVYHKGTVYWAQQTIESALMALLASQGTYFPYHGKLMEHLSAARAFDPAWQWQPASDLEMLTRFVDKYKDDLPIYPDLDFDQMARDLTKDVAAIYDRIKEQTDFDPWQHSQEGKPPMELRDRQES